MKLEQQVISLDLAKRLKALGVKQEGALFYWKNYRNPELDYWEIGDYDPGLSASAVQIAAFTAAELGARIGYTHVLPEWDGYKKNWMVSDLIGYLGLRALIRGQWSEDKETGILWLNAPENAEAEARGVLVEYLVKNKLMEPNT